MKSPTCPYSHPEEFCHHLPYRVTLPIIAAVFLLAPLCCGLWLQIPLAMPPSSDKINFPIFLLFLGLYWFQAFGVSHYHMGSRVLLFPFRLQFAFFFAASCFGICFIAGFQPWLAQYYTVILSLISDFIFVMVAPIIGLHAYYRTKHPETYRAFGIHPERIRDILHFEGDSPLATSSDSLKQSLLSFDSSSFDNTSESSPASSPLKSPKGFASIGQGVTAPSKRRYFRTLAQSVPWIPESIEELKKTFATACSVYYLGVLMYGFCYIFSYVFREYLFDSQQGNVYYAILFSFGFSISFMPVRAFMSRRIRTSARLQAQEYILKHGADEEDAPTHTTTTATVNREAAFRRMRAVAMGFEATSIFYLELLFFVFFRNLFSAVHTYAVFFALEISKYLFEDILRFILPLSRKWFDIRRHPKLSKTFPLSLLRYTCADSYELEVYNTSFGYGIHLMANAASGLCYLVMALLLRYNHNSQFFHYRDMTNGEFQLLISLYGYSYALLFVNFVFLAAYLRRKHGLDLISISCTPFVRNRVSLVALFLIAPHVMQDVYLALLQYNE
eukprot:ANDGO_06298.mRNA.1 hypothetical protein